MGRVSPAYAAGFFDGEGYVGIEVTPASRSRWGRVIVKVGQVDKRPLDALQETYGGRVNGPRCNGQYEWIIATRQADLFLRDIQPHLIVKDEQVAIALEFRDGMGRHNGIGCDQAERDRRLNLRDRMKFARHRALKKAG